MSTVEYRGCKKLVFAEVTTDDNESGVGHGYITGEVKALAPVAEISKTVETSSETHYYDNRGAIIVNSEGADKVTFTIAVPDDENLAEITGRTYDSAKKMFIESERQHKYFAVGYILGEVGDNSPDQKMVWRYKGTFNIPDETAATEDNGTGANNMSLEFTGVYTEHKFENGKGTGVPGVAKAAYIRESDNVASELQWFNQVSTPDTSFPAYSLTITQAPSTTVTVTRNGQALSSGADISAGDVLTISVTGGTVKVNGSDFTSGNTHTVAGNVTVVSTAD